jgi:peptidoglycan hydrolase-like protein with peptidoglycan-binding domain
MHRLLSRPGSRRASVVLTSVLTLATAVAGVLVASPAPAEAANRVTPGNFTGYGFDQCVTPSQGAMDAWLTASPYWAVGIYIAGDSRFCGDDKQTNLTPEWVATQLRNGWRLLPITVGPQASCSARYKDKVRIDPDPADNYAAARTQGRLEARDTVKRARALGIAAKSTLWYDLEAYDIGNQRCRESSLHFLSAWTRTLRNLGFVSGVYSSAASGIRALDDARVLEPGRYVMPDRVWIAEWVKPEDYRQPPTANPPSLLSAFVRHDGWLPKRRMRQYRGDHDETYGGVTINIDTNYLDLGRGTLPGKRFTYCGGVKVDFPQYRVLSQGDRKPQVRALQCFMKRKKLYDGKVSGFYNRGTERAVRRYQRARGLKGDGRMLRSTWTYLLSEGARTPVVKIGSGGNPVRRVQRSLNAASHAGLAVDGIFGPSTTRAVRVYQAQVGLRRTGVVAPDTWARLQAGRL